MKWNAKTASLLGLLAANAAVAQAATLDIQRQRSPEIRYERGTAPGDLRGDQDVPPPTGEGPSGSSRLRPGETRYDEVGFAGSRAVAGGGAADAASVAVHRSLPPGTALEVTSLDTGRTILVLVTGQMPAGADHPIDLSAGAATQLGYAGGERIPVRLRVVTPSAPDMAALRTGVATGARADAPPVLLNALRKRLPATVAAAPLRNAVPARPAPASPRPLPATSRPSAATGRYVVQVAALSSAGNAQALARSMGGFVKQGGGLHRVQLGPFATPAQAEAARGRAARAGHTDARVIAAN